MIPTPPIIPKQEIIQNHFDRFYHSLRQFRELYKPLIISAIGETKEDGCYLCPLCLMNIIIVFDGHYIRTNSDFDMDHYPPASVGGKSQIMVCKKCNNSAGTKFEPELFDFLNHHAFKLGKPDSVIEVRAKLKYKGGQQLPGNYKINFRMAEDGKPMIEFGNQTSKPFVMDFLEYTKENPHDFEMNVSGIYPVEKKVASALTKAAFLYCFSLWGYEFAFSLSGHQMRRVLLQEIDCPYKLGCAYIIEENVDNIPNGVCIVQRPMELRSFTVNIPLIDRENGFKLIAVVFVPDPYSTEWMNPGIENFLNQQAVVSPLLPFDINGNFHGYSTTWNSYVSGEFEPGKPRHNSDQPNQT